LGMREGYKATDNDHLSLYGVDLVELCNKYGTPLFIFDETRLRGNYRRFRDAFQHYYPNVQVYYSIKTNYNLAICEIMREEGAYAEAASGLDLHVAKQAGFPLDHISLDGPYKPEPLLREAIGDGVSLINVESFSELELINKIAGERGRKQKIGLRINTVSRKGFFDTEELYCNPLSRFGFSMEDAYVAIKRVLKLENVELKGLMIHPYWGIHEFLPFVKHVQKEFGVKIDYLNLGGGLSKGLEKIGLTDLVKDLLRQRLGSESNLDAIAHATSAISKTTKEVKEIEEVGRQVAEEVVRTLGDNSAILVFEPGRYIIEDTGMLLLRVGVVKESGGYKWATVDAGTNLNSDFLTRREITLVNRMSASDDEIVNVVGPLLFARDFVAIKKRLPKLREGDVLAVFDCGAYSLSNSTQFLYPRPYVVLIREDGRVSVIREKEKHEDVLNLDRHLPKS
jgi:diaminopimelate decarboxylase